MQAQLIHALRAGLAATYSARWQQTRPLLAPTRSAPLPSTLAVKSGGAHMEAAVGMAVQGGEEREGRIAPPQGPPPPDYFRDVNNHADILSTIISTARHTAGFLPALTGTHLTREQAARYLMAFDAFVRELDRYSQYVDLLSVATQTILNNTIDCNAMISVISSVLAIAMREGTSGKAFEDLKQRVSNMVRSAINFVSEDGKTTSAGFEMVGLHPPPVQGQQASPNPISAVTFTLTAIRKTSGKGASEESFLTIAAYSYQLRSAQVIADADWLAGSRITGVEELERNINAPLIQARHK